MVKKDKLIAKHEKFQAENFSNPMKFWTTWLKAA